MGRHRWKSIPLLQRHVPIKMPPMTTLMMTERGVNTLHYASSLSGVMHAGELRQMDLLPSQQLHLNVNQYFSLRPERKQRSKQGLQYSRQLQETVSFSWARNWPWIEFENQHGLKKKKGKIFTKQMSIHCLEVPGVSGERRGVRLIGRSVANKTIQLCSSD